MVDLQALFTEAGAELAQDGIPLHFGDQRGEYEAALHHAVLLDRRHEGRIVIEGRDRLDLLHRLSTNNMLDMQVGKSRATIFTNANARILDRVLVYALDDESVLLLTEPGRLSPVGNYLQNNVFYNDQVALKNWQKTRHTFALHGPKSDAVLGDLLTTTSITDDVDVFQGNVDDVAVIAARTPPLSDSAWTLVVPAEAAAKIWQQLLSVGDTHGLRPSGGLIYNVLRIRAGHPGVGHELTQSFIPLELGLWDEVSFTKGCYTGQEVLARMESRAKLSRVLVRLQLSDKIEAPMQLRDSDGKRAGQITSAVVAPDGELFAMGVVKAGHAVNGIQLHPEDQSNVVAEVISILGQQPLIQAD